MAVPLRDYCKYCGKYSIVTSFESQSCEKCSEDKNKQEERFDPGAIGLLVIFAFATVYIVYQINTSALKFWELMVILGSL